MRTIVFSFRPWCFFALMLGLVGCGGQEPITQYKVARLPKFVPPARKPAMSGMSSAQGPTRLLGAILPAADKTWFFKFMGPKDEVSKHAAGWNTFVNSIKNTPGRPTWIKPDGWTEQGPSGEGFAKREATLKPEGASVEMTVTTLGGGGDNAEMLLMNINRWRGQMGLAPTQDLGADTKKLDLDGAPLYTLDFSAEGQDPPPGVAQGAGPARPPMMPQASGPQRILAAIIPTDPSAWFFKMTGPPDEVAQQVVAWNALIDSIQLVEGKPKWTLPAGWTEEGPSGNSFAARFATLHPPGTKAEVTVTTFGGANGDVDNFVLMNVNRWRGQVGASMIELADLPKAAPKREVNGLAIYTMDEESAPAPKTAQTPPDDAGRNPLGYTLPEGWQAIPATGIRMAAFKVEEGGESAEVTVMVLGGDPIANVNRWRGQVRLPPLAPAEFEKAVEKVSMADRAGLFVNLVGPDETILGYMASVGEGSSLFVKLQGKNALAAAHKDRFVKLVQSMSLKQ